MAATVGKVWLVGAGPSDPGLITVKGLNILKNADVVVYDKLVGVQILNLIPKNAHKIDVGKSPNNHPVPQSEINKILLDQALLGNKVVRLKGGDSFLFGRGGEELELLAAHNIPFEVVPGVTSAISVPAYAGIPVTHREFVSSLHIITGHAKAGEEPNIDFTALVNTGGTLVFLMGVAALQNICNGLVQAGMPTDMPAAIIERGTTARQRKVVATVSYLYEAAMANAIQNPAIIVVGKVCTFNEDFEWVSKRALHGKRIVVTRPENLCSVFSEKIRSLGGEAIEFPCIKTQALANQKPFEQAIQEIRSYNWLVFTSAAGVEMLFQKLAATGKDIRELWGINIAVIGAGTAKAFEEKGIRVDYMPNTYNITHLAEGLAERVKPEEKVLVLRALAGSKELNRILSEAALSYHDVAVYETVYNTEHCGFSREVIQNGDFDYAAFTSASTVRGFVNALPNFAYSTIQAVCIGEETAAEAKKYGMQTIVAKKATLDELVLAMVSE